LSVGKGHRRKHLRQRKDHLIIVHPIEQQFVGSLIEVLSFAAAASGTMTIAARVMQLGDLPAIVALIPVSLQSTGTTKRQFGQHPLDAMRGFAVAMGLDVRGRAATNQLGYG
jgi:hypothetical protein